MRFVPAEVNEAAATAVEEKYAGEYRVRECVHIYGKEHWSCCYSHLDSLKCF